MEFLYGEYGWLNSRESSTLDIKLCMQIAEIISFTKVKNIILMLVKLFQSIVEEDVKS